MKEIIVIIIAILFWGNLSAQNQAIKEWAMRYNGPGNGIDLLSTMTLDLSGNVYVTGRSSGIGTGQDFATLKYSSDGQSLLELRYNQNSTSWDEPFDIVIDDLGNVYVTGLSSSSGINTIKYNSLGDTIWTAIHNSQDGAQGMGIKVDASYNVYIGGNVWNTGPDAGIAVIKYSSTGNELWSTFLRGDSSYDDSFVDFEIDEYGNVYLNGNTTNQLVEDIFFNDFITVKLDSNGIEKWRQYYSGSSFSDDIPIALDIDLQGDIVIGGSSFEGDDDYVVIKYSPVGVEEWVQIYESPSASEDIPMGMVIDSQNNIIITGYCWRDFEEFNFVTVKYDHFGNELWMSEYNGIGNKRDFAHAITLDSQNNIYITGSSRQGISGNSEITTVKYKTDGSEEWVVSYNDTASGSNIGWSIVTDFENNVYVGAHSVGNTSGWDYLTIKYRQEVLEISDNEIPLDYNYLYQNYPNPFNPNTTIEYQLNHTTPVVLEVFNNIGQKVKTLVDEVQPPGSYHINFNGSNFPSGIYYYRIKAGEFRQQRKMLLVK